ncbi:MAG: biotin--[acetyl-CoA-carboxylase] ligase [Anaerocolumna sp.]|jgi:BirA family biotin operon repressor/biotin-[acetyl-CoA-carboxylase] ligase|nr:biotin--[acetyl-CoA-carboxylase] ligase [Anaerocolumna sp.]
MGEYNNQHYQLDQTIIEKRMETKYFAKRIQYYSEVDSTNRIAKELGKVPGNHGVLVLAEQQNAGRGRLGRNWNSPSGNGIWMTLVLQPNLHPGHASMLTIVAALAVNNAIRNITGLDSFIKWPNDIVVNGKKVCGILTEMNTINEKLEYAIIGIGVNVNQDNFPEELKDTATSILLEGKRSIDRIDLIADIMKHFEFYYDVFLKTENLIKLKDLYNENLVNLNRQVRILEKDMEYAGIALGINETGVLLVKTVETVEDGEITIIKGVVSGEVSVRGIYGYV